MSATESTMQDRRHRLLADVAAQAAATAQELGIANEIAEHIGCAIADRLAENWAGQQINFTLKDACGLSPRERLIAADHIAGKRIYELAIKYHMSERGIRKLLDRLTLRGHLAPPVAQRDLFA